MNFNLPLTENQGEFLYRLLNHHVTGPGSVGGDIVNILDTLDVALPADGFKDSPIPFSKHPLFKEGVLFLTSLEADEDVTFIPARKETTIAGEKTETDFKMGLDLPEMQVIQRALGNRVATDDPDPQGVIEIYSMICEAIGPEELPDGEEAEEEEIRAVVHSDGQPEKHALFMDDEQLHALMVSLKRTYGQEVGTEGEYLLSFLEDVFGEVEEDGDEESPWGEVQMDGEDIPVWQGSETVIGDDIITTDEDDIVYVLGLNSEQFETLGSILGNHVSGPAINDTGLAELYHEMKIGYGWSTDPAIINFPPLPVDHQTFGDMKKSFVVLERNEEN